MTVTQTEVLTAEHQIKIRKQENNMNGERNINFR